MGSAIRAAIALLALAQPNAIDVLSPPFPRTYPTAEILETTRVDAPLEVKPATADAEAVIAGQSYVQLTFGGIHTPNGAVAAEMVWYRDRLFAADWKLLDANNIGEEGRAEREKLALGRARMVVDWLTKHGDVPAGKVTAHGLGRSRPIADNDTDLGRALNRRIEVARTDCKG